MLVWAREAKLTDGSVGIIYTRTGRRFFDDPEIERTVLTRLDAVLTQAGFWKDFDTEWVCLDTELMPWSEKAQTLLSRQYAPVGRAGKEGLSAAVSVLALATQRKNIAFEVDATTSGQNANLVHATKVITTDNVRKIHALE